MVIQTPVACYGLVEAEFVRWEFTACQWLAKLSAAIVVAGVFSCALIVQRPGYRGLSMSGDTIEHKGRLRYIAD